MVKDGLEAGQLKLAQLCHETGFSSIYHVAAAVVYTSIETLYQTLTDRQFISGTQDTAVFCILAMHSALN